MQAGGFHRSALVVQFYVHPARDIEVGVHGDDFLAEGAPADLDWLDAHLDTSFLTKRDMWAGTMDELLSEHARSGDDAGPMHLPEAPKAAKPWGPPPKAGERRVALEQGADGALRAEPQHCSQKTGDCSGAEAASSKQINQMRVFSSLLGEEAPDASAMSQQQAALWLNQRWRKWLSAERADRV